MHSVTAWVAPGYPSLIAFGLRLVHMDDYSGRIFGLALNCTVSAFTCWPIYGIGKEILDRRVGLVSCWLWVFLPTAILFPLEWLWDQSFSAFFVALLIYFTLKLRTESSQLRPPAYPPGYWIGYGLFWSVAVLMNPAIGILLPFLLAWLVYERRSNTLPWRLVVSKSLLFFILGMLPWTVRNYVQFGKIVPVKDNFGLEFWLGNNPSVKRNWSPERHPVGDREQMTQLLQLGEINYMRARQQDAIAFIKSHPLIFIESCFDRFVDTWTARGDIPSDRWVTALHAGSAYIFFSTVFSMAAFAGMFMAWRTWGSRLMPLVMAVVIFPITYYITHSTLRYRHPIEPILTLFAGYAIVRAYAALSARKLRRPPGDGGPSPV